MYRVRLSCSRGRGVASGVGWRGLAGARMGWEGWMSVPVVGHGWDDIRVLPVIWSCQLKGT